MAREIFFAQKNAPHDTKALTLELVDILGRILEIERTDQEALLALADVSYQERVYDKAAEYYERYLKIQPVDTNVRARYASSLTVTGKADQAIRELDKILEKDSDNFAALAYLTVAYAQVGDKKRALDIGARAMELAQEGEARHELKKFIDKIDNREIESLTEPSSVENATPDIKKFEKLLRSNSVAGAKVKSVELEAQFIIKISMNDFPMQAMPEFAKNKFISSLKGYMLQAGLSPERYKLRFIAAEDHRLLGEF
jgi:tetratricopeptide (TPR) repeat protein